MKGKILASIDVTKIPKDKIQATNKDGQPYKNGGKYLPVEIFIDDKLNDYNQDSSIAVTIEKATDTEKAKRVYIGNGRFYESEKQYSAPVNNDEDDIPF